jgi:pimeloyl-ACP methyl ester carboxylesterase
LSKNRLIAVSGWAHPARALGPVASALSDFFDTDLCAATEDIRPVVEASDSPLFLLGWSMGGMLALEAAAGDPDKVAGLILISSTAFFCRGHDYNSGAETKELRAMAQALRRNPEQTLARFMEKAARPAVESGPTIQSRVADALSLGTPELERGLEYLLDTDLRSAAGRVDIPVLLLHGKDDAIVPWQASQFLASRIRRSRLHLYDDYGHDLPIRNPVAVARETTAFARGGS